MSEVIHLLVSFPCYGTRSVEELALGLLPEAERAAADSPRGGTEAADLLRYLSDGRGIVAGVYGGLFTWGVAGNYTDIGVFLDLLRPLWQGLLRPRSRDEELEWDGPSSTATILVLFQSEAAEHASALTIWSRHPHGPPTELPELVITPHRDLPFSWWASQGPVRFLR